MVYEADRPKRPPRQRGAKSDEIDAIRAARELLSRQHLGEPRMRGRREAVRLLLVSRKLAVDADTKHLILIKGTGNHATAGTPGAAGGAERRPRGQPLPGA